ncbi:transcription regulator [Lacticaseibacillus sharpeae JCM 1186 = DSM 20505]|uniref:Transcription regulator n=1 Tax=Lacticaseibacillus sharpeae JCM 1186 = DSM 20505 TaxID=1291052 RepID=A0A0R1ZM69_9LACO|nr:transcription regulator [Lacticaseibacillus sharpeae JCM 1186 = DSM 20505]
MREFRPRPKRYQVAKFGLKQYEKRVKQIFLPFWCALGVQYGETNNEFSHIENERTVKPLYHDIAEDIIAKINNGEFDTKLPTEQALMNQYNVSRNTIRRAIDVVYQRGLLRRVQGSGYYINQLPSTSKAILNLSVGTGGPMHSAEYHLTSHVVTFDKILAPHKLARLMSVVDGTELYRVVRLRFLDDVEYSLECSYYLTSVVPVLTVDAVNNSIFGFVRETYGIRVTSSEDYISMEALQPDQASLLGREVGDEVMALSQLNFYGNNSLFNYSTTYFVYPDLRFYVHSSHLSSN